MKKYVVAGIFLAVFMALNTSVFAAGNNPFEDKSKATVKIDPHAYGVQTFHCNSRTYYSDIPLPKFHGCDSEPVSFGLNGQKVELITAHYDWEKAEDGSNKPRTQTFVQLPDGALFRIGDTRFLYNPQINAFFDDVVGWGRTPFGPTNITLERFAQKNLDTYANTFCVNFYLRHPFKGTFGWCQNDRLLGGNGGYLQGAMTFTRAALAVQDYIYVNKVRVKTGKLLTPETMTALNTDADGWLYYAFGVPAMGEKNYLNYYTFRIYFNGRIEMRELRELPQNPDLL